MSLVFELFRLKTQKLDHRWHLNKGQGLIRIVNKGLLQKRLQGSFRTDCQATVKIWWWWSVHHHQLWE